MLLTWLITVMLLSNRIHIDAKTSCSKTFYDQSRTIESPNFPASYSNNLNCEYKIKSPKNTRIKLKFGKLDLEMRDRRDKCRDFVKISDGLSSQSKTLYKVCGSGEGLVDKDIVSSSNKIKVKFVTDEKVTDKGFQFKYETIEVCPDLVMQASRSTIKSPGYPNNYTRNLDCNYKIQLAKNTRIQLIFREVKLEPGKDDGSCGDYIEVYDGITTWSKVIQKAFCGNAREIVNIPIISSGNKLRVRFVTDETISNKGFELTYDPFVPAKVTDVTQKVTGVVIGTACGLVFLILTFLAICHSRHLTIIRRRLRRTPYERASTDSPDVVEGASPPSYTDVMSSPEKYPLTPNGSRATKHFFSSGEDSESSHDEEDQPPRYSALMLLATAADDDSTTEEDLEHNVSRSVTTDV